MDYEFKVGDRCFFGVKHGICSFGTVMKVIDEVTDKRLLILADDGNRYTAMASEILNLGRKHS